MRQTLRLLSSVSLAAIVAYSADAQQVGINRNGATPAVKAILDVDVSGTSGNPFQGMLIPRMTYAQRLLIPVSNANTDDQGLWVYQTDDGPAPVGDPTLAGETKHGYWYYQYLTAGNPANRWIRWSTGNGSWKLTGNGNTVATTHYLGTPLASNDDLFIRTSNNLAVDPPIRINATDGFTGISLAAAPVERLEVEGGVQVGPTTLNTEGAIEFDPLAGTPNRWHFGNVDGTATGWKRMENAETRYINQTYCPVIQVCGSTPGSKIRGTWGGTALTSSNLAGGTVNTPFVTNTGAVDRNGHRVQYIYTGADLTAAGLCPGFITEIAFYVVTGEAACTPGLNCPDIKVDIRMGNTALATFGPVVNNQLAGIGGLNQWDAPTEASAAINTNSTVQMLCQPGWMTFPIAGAGFNWTGGNLIIDVSLIRANSLGNNPPVQHEVVAGYTCAKWVGMFSGPLQPAHGNTYQDFPLTTNAMTGTNSVRPVTRFNGIVASDGYGAPATGTFLNYGGGLMIDHNVNNTIWADGAYRGPGSIRASVAVYDGNTALSDHVFDRYFTGDVAPQDAAQAEEYAYVPLPELKGYLENERHLPSMPSREQWETNGESSLGQLQTGLWESVETQALYITQLEKDLSALESLAFGKLKDASELEELIADVKESRRLTEAQKLHLTNALRARLDAQPHGK